MKDLTHYFADTTKSCESTPSDIKDNRPGRDQQEYSGSSPKKRKRVKIKISRTNSKTRVCDVVESKNDLIDKTPSPFARANGGQKMEQSLFVETPNKISPHLPLDECELAEKQNDRLQVLMEDKTAHVLKERNIKLGKKKVQKNKKNSLIDSVEDECLFVGSKTNIALHNVDDVDDVEFSGREESNAFQVLMNSSKPVHCATQQNVSQEKITSGGAEDRDKLKKNKEKLVDLADKKGYSKRKLADIEESERIEKKIENRMKLFKIDPKANGDPEVCGGIQKQLPGNLLNYFSKTTMDCEQKDVTTVSTIVVKADVHMPDDAVRNCFYKGKLQLTQTENKSRKKKLSRADDVAVTASEKLALVDYAEEKQAIGRTSKTRWSMRIKLHPSKDEEFPGVDSDEEMFSPRSQTKFKEDPLYKSNKNRDDILNIDNEPEANMDKSKEETGKSNSRRNKKRKSSLDKVNDNSLPENKTQDLRNQINSSIQEIEQISECNSTISARQVLSHRISRKNGLINVDSNEVIVLSDEPDNNESNITLKKKGSEKLAPLFTKKPKIDQAVIAARRLFLHSDTTGAIPKKSEKKEKSTGPCFLPFPLISHVNQHDDNSPNDPNDIKIPLRQQTKYTASVDVRHFKDVLDLLHLPTTSAKAAQKAVCANIEDVLTDIETHCSKARKIWAHVSSVAQGLTDSKAKSSTVEGKGKSRRTVKKKDTVVESTTEEDKVFDSWTYKYKPLSTPDVVGNEDAVTKLKLWLDGWRCTLREDSNSENEFYSSDCSYSTNENNQVAVLIGPYGVGKSASIYAVAEELGYSVLEVNASSKRPGKKILKELEEATKSHRIKKDKMNPAFFLINKPKVENKIPQKTLILLEDIDLIFEEDEGFVNATYQLASNTKRPIVMTCRDVCPHLSKMAPEQNKIYFQSVDVCRMRTLLELITLAETGYRLPHSYLTDLLQSGDLRKALLQLQFLLLSGPIPTPLEHVSFNNTFWQDMRHHLYKPTIKITKKQITKKNLKKVKMGNKNEDVLYDLAHKLDVISVMTSLIDVDDPALNISNIRERPSLSLTEDTSPYCVSKNISFDIGHWLRNKVICNAPIRSDWKAGQNSILLKKQLNTGVNFALSSVTSTVLSVDRRAVAVDYLPSVRTICRSEELRIGMNSKRGNRFFHYLHGLKLPSTSTKPNILSAACKMMQDKVENNTSTTVNRYNSSSLK